MFLTNVRLSVVICITQYQLVVPLLHVYHLERRHNHGSTNINVGHIAFKLGNAYRNTVFLGTRYMQSYVSFKIDLNIILTSYFKTEHLMTPLQTSASICGQLVQRISSMHIINAVLLSNQDSFFTDADQNTDDQLKQTVHGEFCFTYSSRQEK